MGPIDKFKKAFDYLNRDPENSNPTWTEHLKPTDMPEKEPIVVCGNHSGYYATPEDLVNDLPQVECEDELDEEAMDALVSPLTKQKCLNLLSKIEKLASNRLSDR